MIDARLDGGDDAQAGSFDGRLLHLICPRALAPGQPAQIRVLLDPVVELGARSQGSKKREDGSFDVRFRLVNLTRVHRDALTDALG